MNDKNINKKSTQSGRSMIEMLGVLAIVGVLSVGGIAGYSKAMTKFKINKSIDQISHIVANIRTLYAQQTTYAGLNTANAIKMGVIPNEMGTGTTLTNPFNGEVFIYPGNGDTYSSNEHNDLFSISYGGLDVETCIALASYNWGDSNSTGLITISIATNEMFDVVRNGSCMNPSGWYSCPRNMTLIEAQEHCNSIFNQFGTLSFNLTYK